MRAFIVGESGPVAETVRRLLAREGVECSAAVIAREAAAEHLRHAEAADVVVVALGADAAQTLETLQELRPLTPARLLAVGPAGDPKLVLAALRGGADDYVDETALEDELPAALGRFRGTSASGADAGRVIAVLAASGGSGSSTLAANVAAALAREHGAMALFDLKPSSGDLASLLDLKPAYSLADVCQNVDRLDRVMFERCLARHDSGVHLLAAPARLIDIPHVTAEGIRQALALARNLFPYVVLDLEHSFRADLAQLLKQTDLLLLVLRLDFSAVNNTRRTLDYLGQFGISRERVRLVVNRYGQAKEVPPGKAEDALGMKIWHYVPDDPRTVNRANNNGVPAILEAPSAKVSRSLARLAASVNGRHEGG